MLLLLYIYIGLWEYLIQKAGATNDENWYSVTKLEGVEGWVELRDHERSIKLNLTKQYLAFMNQSLKFQFPFYGEDFREVKITTQGFISLSDVISDTQYIAPLMADFKPLPLNDPTQDIRILRNSNSVIIQWGDMLLAKQSSVGKFSFQLRLDSSGAIYMIYKTVPLDISEIEANNHAVAAGISGGHADGQTIPIPYNTITLRNITSNSTFVLKPVATCQDQTNCSMCTSWSSMCYWCEAIQRCSTGQDRLKHEWLQNGSQLPPGAAQECSPRILTSPQPRTSPTSHSFATFSLSHPSPDNGSDTPAPTTAQHTTPQPTTPQNNATANNNYTIDNKPDETTAEPPSGVTTETPPEKAPLPIIYIILIVASSLSFVLVLSAFVILVWHKRRGLSLHTATLNSHSQTNNLLSNGHGANGHGANWHDSNGHGVKCISDPDLSHI